MVALGAELDLLRPLVPGRFFLEAEVAWAVRYELAFSLDDVLARRTRLAQELPDRGAAIAPRVAQILGAEFGWGESRQRLEVDSYLATARREYSVAASGTARAAGRRGVDHDGLTAARRRHRPVTESAASFGDGVPGRPAARVLRRSVHESDPGRGRVDGRRGRGPRDRVAGGLVRGGSATSRAGGRPARGGAGRGVAADVVSRVADLGPDRADRAGAGRGGRGDAGPVIGRHVPDAIDRRQLRPHPSPRNRPRSQPRTVASGEFHGTDDFHFGRGTARIVETAPGAYTLRLADFSVRNGPDLYVYLSPDANDYDDGALELGKLKATDGAFGYDLPPGTDPADFASAIIWCKQFSHLFAVAPLAAD